MAEAPRDRSGPVRGGFWAWWTVGVFLLLYVFSFIDRQIIGMMVQPIERDLKITDVQISLLQGPAFGLFYVLCGLPLGWMVDRFSRRWLTAIGVLAWGAATCVCGVAGSLGQLMVGRLGVGLGESVLTPAAQSLIAEQFPPKRLSLALSVYTMGAVIGGGIAIAAGGGVVQLVSHAPPVAVPLFGQVRAWQLAFLAVGLPTMVLAPLTLTVRDRRLAARAAKPAVSLGEALRGSFFRTHWRIAWGVPVGFGMTNIIVGALTAWTPTYLIRVFGWTPGKVGLLLGLVTLVPGAIGQIGGAATVDWLYARGVKDAHTRYHIVSLVITVPCLIAAILSHEAMLFLAAFALFQCVTYPYVGYASAALQLFSPSHLRGRVSSVFLAVITVMGLGLGPTGAAFVSERLLGDKSRIGEGMAAVAAICAPLGMLILWQVGRAMRAAAVRGAEAPASLAADPAAA